MFSHASTISQLSAKDGTSFAPPGHTLRPPLPCSAQATSTFNLPACMATKMWNWCSNEALCNLRHVGMQWFCFCPFPPWMMLLTSNDFAFVEFCSGWKQCSVAKSPYSLWLWWMNDMSHVCIQWKTMYQPIKIRQAKARTTNTHVWTSKNYFTSKTITPKGQVKHTTMYSI